MHRRTRIKICGICRPEDAVMAADAGADAIGLIFHPASPRYVSPDRAREIVAALPPFVSPVRVYVDAAVSSVLEDAIAIGLRHVQLHGDEQPEHVAQMPGRHVIKAIRVERERFVEVLAKWRQAVRSLSLANLKGLVLETANTGQPGGSGVPNDWEAVREAQRAGGFDGLPPIIAAGGLTPENVGDVVRTIRPFGVDVVSGVEQSRGVKSEEKVRAFVRAVREADGS